MSGDDDKRFSEDVTRILQMALAFEVPLESGGGEPERLAALLMFLRTLVVQCINNELGFLPDEHPRAALAFEALRMVQDLISGTDKHPLHRFVEGQKKSGRPTSSLAKLDLCLFAAVAKRAREITHGTCSRKELVRALAKRKVFKTAITNPGTTTNDIGAVSRDPSCQVNINMYYDGLVERGGTSLPDLLARADYLYGLRHGPLSMLAAKQVMPVQTLISTKTPLGAAIASGAIPPHVHLREVEGSPRRFDAFLPDGTPLGRQDEMTVLAPKAEPAEPEAAE